LVQLTVSQVHHPGLIHSLKSQPAVPQPTTFLDHAARHLAIIDLHLPASDILQLTTEAVGRGEHSFYADSWT